MAAAWRSSWRGSMSSGATWVRSVPHRPPTCRPGPGSRRATSGRPSPRSTTRARWSASGTRPGASCWTWWTRHDPGRTRPRSRGSCRCGTKPCSHSATARGSSRTRTGRASSAATATCCRPSSSTDGSAGSGGPSRTAPGHGSRSSRSVGLPRPTGARSRPRPTGWPASSGPLEPAVYARYRTSGARRL